MRCEAVGYFFDGELPRPVATEFRHHLAACRRCWRELHELMQLEALGMAPGVWVESATGLVLPAIPGSCPDDPGAN